MTPPGSLAGTGVPESTLGTSRQPGTSAEVLRAAANFIESAGPRSGLSVIASETYICIRVSEPYDDAAGRHAIVTKLARLIGGTLRRHDQHDYAVANLRADGAIGGVRAIVETDLLVRRARALTGLGKPLAVRPGGQVTAVPGRLPEGWRWVTELDARPKRAAPWKPRRTAATTTPSADAPRLAARDCPPLTSAVLQAAAHQTTATRPARPGATAQQTPRQHPW
jgi:hypothetical protein